MARWKPLEERTQEELIDDLRGLATAAWDARYVLLDIFCNEHELDNPQQILPAIKRLEICLVAVGLYHDKLPEVVKQYLQEVGESDGTL